MAEKANTSARFGLSADTEATEATPSDSAFREYQDERRKHDDFLVQAQMEVVPSEVEQLNAVFGATPLKKHQDVIDEVPANQEETRESVSTQPDNFER